MDSYSALTLILVGQTELRETLKLQVNKAISQRVDLRFNLEPLSKDETAAYLAKHLEAVKAPGEIFNRDAVGVLHEYCEGLPRLINKVAVACLMAGAARSQKTVDDRIVREVIQIEFE
jgi:type II secretory pathway predicted ATPase ExeA